MGFTPDVRLCSIRPTFMKRLILAAAVLFSSVGIPHSSFAAEPLRASFQERTQNPRSRSAKIRWAERAG